jgi:hypothetical protein
MNKCLTIDDWRDAVDRINSEVHVSESRVSDDFPIYRTRRESRL